MGFRALRVINEDRVQAGQGFPPHAHRDMEILSYVLDGGLGHNDSMGNGSVIRPGDVQRMSAGTGVTHAEMNASKKDPVHFLQIWILPEKQGIKPGYEQKTFAAEEKRGKMRLVASREGVDGSVTVHQDVKLYAGLFDQTENADLVLDKDRHAFVHVVRGSLKVNGEVLNGGDAAAISEEQRVHIEGVNDAEVLLFDLA
jgi:redox-sensitive bicupin YhaK (pirin superfamily)